LLHLEKVRIGGRIVNNLKVSFTDGEIVDVSYEGSSELDKNPVQEQLKDAGVSLIGLGLNVSLLENLSKMDGYVPEVIRRKSALSLELGEDVVGLIEYSKIGRLSSVKYNGQLSDVIREGLFMPIGSDVMNIPLMKLYQQEALDAPAEKDVVETAEDIPANEAAEEQASEDAAGTEEGLPQEIIE
ncbi:MAG: hypothetical protein J6P72_06310, partial [Firmicutes bacterium]|nr:hypothetical protein [Bacillota bacterium]